MSEAAVKQSVLASRPKGLPTHENFRLQDVSMPELPPGGLLLRVLYLSLDPYMRGRMDDRKSYAKPVQLGDVMTGEAVAQVLASKHPDYAEGDIVLAPTGRRTHALSDGRSAYGQKLRKLDPAVAPVTTGLGVLGMPGFTAYAGLRVIGKPAPEEIGPAVRSGAPPDLTRNLARPADAVAGRACHQMEAKHEA